MYYINRRRSTPFYLSLHYTAPHWPWQDRKGGERVVITDKTIEPITMGGGGSLKLYAEMMRSLDDGVGRVMQALKVAGLDRNTFSNFHERQRRRAILVSMAIQRGKVRPKGGGIRVPAIIRWPGMIPARRVISQMTITMDWTATILAAAGTQPANGFPLDGIDLLPVPYPRRSRSRADILLADWTAGRRS